MTCVDREVCRFHFELLHNNPGYVSVCESSLRLVIYIYSIWNLGCEFVYQLHPLNGFILRLPTYDVH